MNLHLDPSAFETLLLDQADRTGLRRDVLEKDYYVSLILEELAEKQKLNRLPAYFKGGTALYKALKRIRRFSEDIDLTVYVEDCPSNSQKQKRLEEATEKYHCLNRYKEDPANENKKGSITTIYKYNSAVDVDRNDVLQRFEKVKIEATSFTISEPHTPLEIAPLLYENATSEQQGILQSQYQVGPFQIETIKLERIFIDKVFAAKFYFEHDELRETSKHLYDIIVMLGLDEIKRIFQMPADLDYLIQLKQKEEQTRIGSNLSRVPIAEFRYLHEFEMSPAALREFNLMQRIYVLEDRFLLAETSLKDGLSQLRKIFANQ